MAASRLATLARHLSSAVAPRRPWTPQDEERVRQTFLRQEVMRTVGATLTAVGPGTCEISMPFQDKLTQQNGFLHAGIATMLMDNAAGISANTLMKPDHGVLTVSFTVSLLAPAVGTRFTATGSVIRAGASVSTCRSDLKAHLIDGTTKHVATMLATLMSIPPAQEA